MADNTVTGSSVDPQDLNSVTNHCTKAPEAPDHADLGSSMNSSENEKTGDLGVNEVQSTETDMMSQQDDSPVSKSELLALNKRTDNMEGLASKTADCGSKDQNSDRGVTSGIFSHHLDLDDAANNSAELSHLKKDDSGIVMERSPGKHECPREDDESNHSAGENGDKKPDRVNRPSTSNESEGIVDDIGDIELGATAAVCDNKAASLTDSEDTTSSLRDKPLGVVVEEELSEVKIRRPRRPRTHRHLRLRSDSDDDDDNDDSDDNSRQSSSESMEDDKSHNSGDQSDEDAMEIDLDLPKDTWRPFHEITCREKGFSSHIPASYVFRNKCGGSINLVQRFDLYSKLEHHEGCVNALHFNEQGTLLASGSDDLNIVVWKWLSKEHFFYFDSGHRSNVFQSKFMPFTGDTHIVSCARDGQLRLAELSSTGTCKATKRLAQHRGAAHKLALLQDSSHVFYSCGEDAVTMEIDLREDKPHKLSTTKERNQKVALYSIHSNPFKSHEYCVSGRDPYIRVFDKRMANADDNSGLVKKYCPHNIESGEGNTQTNVTCAVYSYNGQEIVGTYNDDDIYLFDNRHSDGADASHRYRGHRNNATVKGINFYGPKSEFIVSGSDCGNVFLWEKESEKVVQYFAGDDGGVVNVLEPHPHFPILATSGLDHDVKIWMPTAKETTKLEGLKKIIKTNKKEREEERQDPAEAIDSSMFWRLMQHFRRAARRRARQEGEDLSTDTENSDAQDSEDADDDDDENPGEPMQCAPS